MLRGNLIWQILSSNGGDFPLDRSGFVNLGGNTAALIDAVDQTLLYLTTLSGQHAVQY